MREFFPFGNRGIRRSLDLVNYLLIYLLFAYMLVTGGFVWRQTMIIGLSLLLLMIAGKLIGRSVGREHLFSKRLDIWAGVFSLSKQLIRLL